MDMLEWVVNELHRRKGEWSSFAKILGVHRKTIERMAHKSNDPRYGLVRRVHELLTISKPGG